jgi:RecA-family ATPase
MSSKYSYKPALGGKALDEAVELTSDVRCALIEGLVYERSVILISADGGTGKSTIAANVIAQASIGLPVFNSLHVPSPLLSYYIPFERGSEEIRERLKHIKKVINYNSDNIRIFENDSFPIPNLYKDEDQDFLLESIGKDCGDRKPDIVFYDPIYMAVSGGLSNEDKVSVFVRFNVRLMRMFGCATWLNHHTGKQTYSVTGNPIEKEDPYYGSSFLKNHCTVSYYLKENKETDGTILIRKKDNLQLSLKKIILNYEPESYTSFMKDAQVGLAASDRLKIALRQYAQHNKEFTFRQLEGCLVGVSTSWLRSLLNTPPFCEVIHKRKSIGSNTLYSVSGQI